MKNLFFKQGMIITMTEAVFFDRDGTLGLLDDDRYPDTFVPFDFLPDVLRQLKQAGIASYIYTNQSCVARGLDRGYDFAAEFAAMGLDDWFICPHDRDDGCDCRKPKSGLLLEARQKHGLDLTRCYVVGDRLTDLEAGIKVGCKAILVRTGRGKSEVELLAATGWPKIDIAEDVRAAVEIVLGDG